MIVMPKLFSFADAQFSLTCFVQYGFDLEYVVLKTGHFD